jgi:transcriptional regulator with XRE-family HTH domain
MDKSAPAGVLTLDLHRLDLRYAPLRLPDPPAITRLARSIEADGQLVPCIAVAGEVEAFILVDGYRRIAALRHLGRDTAEVECWQADLAQALLGVLARTRSRSFAPIEEAFLLRELISGAQLSQHEVARRCGRDVSWVSRRLQLLGGLSDALLEAVRQGLVSTWAAVRILGPLARANARMPNNCLRPCARRHCRRGSWRTGSRSINARRDRCASAWSSRRSSCSKPSRPGRKRRSPNVCARGRKARCSPTCASWKRWAPV